MSHLVVPLKIPVIKKNVIGVVGGLSENVLMTYDSFGVL